VHGRRQGADRLSRTRGAKYELIIASKGEHVHKAVLHIQNVNAYGGRFKQWLVRFKGVATWKWSLVETYALLRQSHPRSVADAV
jgi:hypothetical protein